MKGLWDPSYYFPLPQAGLIRSQHAYLLLHILSYCFTPVFFFFLFFFFCLFLLVLFFQFISLTSHFYFIRFDCMRFSTSDPACRHQSLRLFDAVSGPVDVRDRFCPVPVQ